MFHIFFVYFSLYTTVSLFIVFILSICNNINNNDTVRYDKIIVMVCAFNEKNIMNKKQAATRLFIVELKKWASN